MTMLRILCLCAVLLAISDAGAWHYQRPDVYRWHGRQSKVSRMVDSRDNHNAVFAVDIDIGVELAAFTVNGSLHHDWEDLDYGPCADDCNGNCNPLDKPSRYCLYIADIGNHGGDGARDDVYMIREPDSLGPRDGKLYNQTVNVVSRLTFSWTEPDAESLMISPKGVLYVVSKVTTGRAQIAEIPNSAWGGTYIIDQAETGTLKILTSHHDPQGGSISPDGKEMIFVAEEAVFYYSTPNMDYVNTVRTQVPVQVSTYIPEDDAEAITWAADGQGFYTFSRGTGEFIYYYPRSTGGAIVG